MNNNSTQGQIEGSNYIKKKYGFSLDPQRFISAAYLSAYYAKSKNYKKLYIIGGKAVFDELKIALNNPELFGEDDSGKMDLDDKFFKRFKSKENVDAVIVGKDSQLNYYKLSCAICSVNKGADLVASHCRLLYRKNDIRIPNCGTTVKAIEAATGKKAFNVGKPGAYGIKVICEKFGINFEKEKKNMLIVGDNLGVEIKLANEIGINSLLVLSGDINKENLAENLVKNKGVTPTYILPYLTYGL